MSEIESWLVFAVAICADRLVDSDKAFDLFDRGPNPGRYKICSRPTIYGLEEVLIIEDLRKAGKKWREIGDHFKLPGPTVYERYKYARRLHLGGAR